jgi:hypothetical protein
MMSRKILAVIAIALVAAGCKTVPVRNIVDSPVMIPAGQTSSDAKVEEAILRAGSGLGWVMKKEKAGLIVGTLNLRTHMAVVDIPYSSKNYSILYKSSVNLDAQDGQIHSNYNGWVENLDKAIKAQLAL